MEVKTMKTITLKEIKQQAQELHGWDGYYKNMSVPEIIADLKQAYKEDGYKITK